MENFQNGRSIDFVQKSNLILFVYFTETMPEKIVFRYFGQKTIIIRPNDFQKGVSPWILSKNRTVSYRCFSQNFFQKRSFLILWKEKNNFKKKKDIFHKGLVHGLWPKIELFLICLFFLRKLYQKRSFLTFCIENNEF